MADPTSIDAATAVYNLLRTGIGGSPVRSLLCDAVGSVYEAGDLTEDILRAKEVIRRTSGEQKALVLAVQDSGEEPYTGDVTRQFVTVRVYDRFRGYRNIRAVRRAIILLLRNQVVNVVADGSTNQGLIGLQFVGRTGHRYDAAYAVEYEAVAFAAIVEMDID